MTNDTLSLAEEAIDAIVEEWHSEPTSNDALDERLGWSAAAYNAWVKDGTLPLSIQRILEALRSHTPAPATLDGDNHAKG